MKNIYVLLSALFLMNLGASAQQMSEDFESGTFPPTGWQEYHNGVDALDQFTPTAHGGIYSARFDDVSLTDTSILISDFIPNLDPNSELKFWEYQNWTTWMDYHGVYISVNAGTLTEILNVPAPGQVWTERTIDLSAYSGQGV